MRTLIPEDIGFWREAMDEEMSLVKIQKELYGLK